MTARVILSVVERHANDAAFLWSLRDRAVDAPHFSSAHVGQLDERIEAHVDGLRVAGEAGIALCLSQIEGGEAGEVFAAAAVALGLGDEAAIGAVLDAVRAAAKLSRGLVSALGWIDDGAAIEARLDAFLDARDPLVARIGVAGAAVRRRAPGAWLGAAAHAEDAGVRARGLCAAGELGWAELRVPLLQSLDDADAECRFWAAWSAALLGEPAGVARLHDAALSGGPHAAEAVAVLAARLPAAEANAFFRSISAPEETRRLALLAAGALGDTSRMPWLLEQAKDPALARPAGEAMTRITGVDLEAEGLSTTAPEGFSAGPTDDPADERVEMDPDADLPWPAVEAVEQWWAGRKAALPAGVRRLLGEPIGAASCRRALGTGLQRIRAAAAVELSVLEPGKGVANVRARADRGLLG